MKRLLAICLCIFVLLFLSACEKYRLKDTNYVIEEYDGVILTASADISSTGGIFVLENSPDEKLSCGMGYALEKKVGENRWKMLLTSEKPDSRQSVVEPETKQCFIERWESRYGKLPAGQYRYVKDVEVGGRNRKIACEFEIK